MPRVINRPPSVRQLLGLTLQLATPRPTRKGPPRALTGFVGGFAVAVGLFCWIDACPWWHVVGLCVGGVGVALWR